MTSIFNANFWNSFWPSFFSGLFLTIIFSFILTFVIKKIRQPKLDVRLSIGKDSKGNYSLYFYCINSGSIGLRPNEIQWHFYIDLALWPQANFKEKYNMIIFDGNAYSYFLGTNEESCLPGTSTILLSIPVKLRKEINENIDFIDEAKCYYSLTTINGQKKHNGISSYFRKPKVIQDYSFVRRRVFEIKHKDI